MKSRLAFIPVFALALAACSLAEDVTPLPGSQVSSLTSNTQTTAVAPTAAPLPTDSGLGYPASRPSAAAGAAVYAEHCAACHGSTGQADGPMTPQLPAPPADLSSPAAARAATPLSWFEIITQGRQEELMPPFAGTLSETDRWNLVAFLYTLSTPQTQIDAGRTVYQANCARCHGETGAGERDEGEPLTKFTDAAFMADRSQADFFAAVTNGAGQMPAFASTLTDDERWAAIDYLSTFAYEYTPPPAGPVESSGAVTGRVINRTAGAALPAGLVVSLHGFDSADSFTTITATVTASGDFRFTGVPYISTRQFVVTASYRDLLYASEVQTFPADKALLDLPVTVYETTPDPAAVRVANLHVFFDFQAGQVGVGEVYVISNGGDRSVWNPEGTLEFPLPAEASDLQVSGMQEGADYKRTAEGMTLIMPVTPGEQALQLVVTFSLPYSNRLAFEQKVLYPVDAANVLVPNVGVKLTGNLLDEGPQDIQGTSYELYSAAGFNADGSLSFTLNGKPSTSGATAPAADPVAIAFGSGALLAVAGGVGYWWYRRTQTTKGQPALPADREALLQAIADLDDAFENGEVGEQEYERRRARLKAQLLKLMQDD